MRVTIEDSDQPAHSRSLIRAFHGSQRASNTFKQVAEAKKFEGVFLCRTVC